MPLQGRMLLDWCCMLSGDVVPVKSFRVIGWRMLGLSAPV